MSVRLRTKWLWVRLQLHDYYSLKKCLLSSEARFSYFRSWYSCRTAAPQNVFVTGTHLINNGKVRIEWVQNCWKISFLISNSVFNSTDKFFLVIYLKIYQLYNIKSTPHDSYWQRLNFKPESKLVNTSNSNIRNRWQNFILYMIIIYQKVLLDH